MGKRTSQLDEITTIANSDLLYGVDVDDLTHSPEGTSKKFTKTNLLKEINSRAGDIESDVSDLQGIVSGLLDWFYPLGTIYETTSVDLDTTTKMDAHFGGTWEVYGVGRVLVAKSEDTEFDTIGETGGAKTHTLDLTQIPAHSHNVTTRYNTKDAGGYIAWFNGAATGSWTETTASQGGGQAHNNLQPYIVTYLWKRLT